MSKGQFIYGIKTGFNEAFVIDEATKKRLIEEDPKSTEIIKPFSLGEISNDISPLKVRKIYILSTQVIPRIYNQGAVSNK